MLQGQQKTGTAARKLLCVAQEARLRALWWPRGLGWGWGCKGGSGEVICAYTGLTHFTQPRKPVQHCEAITLEPISCGSFKKKTNIDTQIQGEKLHFCLKVCSFKRIYNLVYNSVEGNKERRLCWHRWMESVLYFPSDSRSLGEMATHSSTLAYKISWTEEPSGLQSMEPQRVGHDWVTEPTHTLSAISDSVGQKLEEKRHMVPWT